MAGDHSEARAGFPVFMKSNCNDWHGNGRIVRITNANERAGAIRFKNGDPTAFIGDDDMGGKGGPTKIHGHILRIQNHPSVGVDHSCRIDEESAAESDAERVGGLHTHNGLLVFLKNFSSLVCDALGQIRLRRVGGSEREGEQGCGRQHGHAP